MKTLFKHPNARKRFIDPNQFRLFPSTKLEKQVEEVSANVARLKVELYKAATECSSAIYSSLMEAKLTVPVKYLPAKWERIKENSGFGKMPTRAAITEILCFSKIMKDYRRNENVRKEGRKIFATTKALLILESLELQIKNQNYKRVQEIIESLSKMRKNSVGAGVYDRIGIYSISPQEEDRAQMIN